MYAAEHNHIRLGIAGMISKAERITYVIGEILDVSRLVVVGKNDGIALFFEAQDFSG